MKRRTMFLRKPEREEGKVPKETEMSDERVLEVMIQYVFFSFKFYYEKFSLSNKIFQQHTKKTTFNLELQTDKI